MRPAARRALSAAAALALACAMSGCAVKTADPGLGGAPDGGLSGDRGAQQGSPDQGSGDRGSIGSTEGGTEGTGSGAGSFEDAAIADDADCAAIGEVLGYGSPQLSDLSAFAPYVPDDRLRLGEMASSAACSFPEAYPNEVIAVHMSRFAPGDYPYEELLREVPQLAGGAPAPEGGSPYTGVADQDFGGQYIWGSSRADGEPYGLCHYVRGDVVMTMLFAGGHAAPHSSDCMLTLEPLVEHVAG